MEHSRPNYDDERKQQILAIKQKLLTRFNAEGISYNKLLEELNNRYNFNLQYNTLRKTISMEQTSTFDAMCLVALCKYWNINLSYLFASSDSNTDENEDILAYISGEPFEYLNDPAYEGTFHCYTYPRSNSHDDAIWKGILRITISKKHAEAYLEIHETNDDGASPKIKKFWGTAVYAKTPRNIILYLRSPFGSYCFINFLYVPYNNNGKMYYRTATFTSCTINGPKYPRMQKMIILDHEASPENLKYIKGLLKIDTESIMIPVDDFDCICRSHEEVANFKIKFENELSVSHYDCYIFDPLNFKSRIKSITDDDMKALMILSGYSLSPNYTELNIHDKIPSLSQDF